MAARKDSRLKTQHREAIQTSMLINRVNSHALGDVEMSATQLQAANILLKKTLPDLKATEVTGADGEALFPTDVNVNAVGPKLNP